MNKEFVYDITTENLRDFENNLDQIHRRVTMIHRDNINGSDSNKSIKNNIPE